MKIDIREIPAPLPPKEYVLTLNEDELKFLKYWLTGGLLGARLYQKLSIIEGNGSDYNPEKCFK